MKQKTSVTLEARVLAEVDAIAGVASPSRIIEQAVVEYLERRRRSARDRRNLEILNRVADDLNREAEDVLAFQVDP